MTQQITLYTTKICPYAHRTELALKETDLEYQTYQIDLQNKPEWYAFKVNPASKVPALTYGGPPAPPDDPSPESIKLAESYVLLEFIADLSGKLLPSDPVKRAQARFFVETVSSKFATAYIGALMRGESPSAILPVIETLQELLPADGGFVIGQYSMADAAVTPFLARASIMLEEDIGMYESGLGRSVWDSLQNDSKYARYRQYYLDVTSRQNFKETFDEAYVRSFMKVWGRNQRKSTSS